MIYAELKMEDKTKETCQYCDKKIPEDEFDRNSGICDECLILGTRLDALDYATEASDFIDTLIENDRD